MRRSEVVQAIADIASKGKYTVEPSGARYMNYIFEEVAKLINELEAEENVVEGDNNNG